MVQVNGIDIGIDIAIGIGSKCTVQVDGASTWCKWMVQVHGASAWCKWMGASGWVQVDGVSAWCKWMAQVHGASAWHGASKC